MTDDNAPQPPTGFTAVLIFDDPTPEGLINNRVIRRFIEIASKTDLSKDEGTLFVTTLTLVGRKMVSVWNHKERYKNEQTRLIAEVQKFPQQRHVTHIDSGQVLFAEFDEFLVQVKSVLDHLVKIPVPILGRKVWTLRTFGNKGEDVLKALKGNLPGKYKELVRGIEKLIFDRNRPWLEATIEARDKVNHYLDGGIPIEHFSVHRQSDGSVRVPLASPGHTIEEFLETIWVNLLHLVEDFIAMFVMMRLQQGVVLFHGNVGATEPKSPWRVVSRNVLDVLVARGQFTKI